MIIISILLLISLITLSVFYKLLKGKYTLLEDAFKGLLKEYGQERERRMNNNVYSQASDSFPGRFTLFIDAVDEPDMNKAKIIFEEYCKKKGMVLLENTFRANFHPEDINNPGTKYITEGQYLNELKPTEFYA